MQKQTITLSRWSGTDQIFLFLAGYLVILQLLDFHATATSLLFMARYGLTILYILFHYAAIIAPDTRWSTLALTWGGSLLPTILRETESSIVIWSVGHLSASIILMFIGHAIALVAMVALGRRFSLEPTHRGLQVTGIYRVIRHPLYAAYVLVVGGFVIDNISWWNCAVVISWIFCQYHRIQLEESLLRTDPEYQAYCLRVRWRLLPGIW